MREYENIVGQRFGKLVVKELLPADGKGKQMHLGTYSNYEDAVKARQRAEEEIFGQFLSNRDE